MTKRIDWLRGCATALVTPFTADGAVDEAALTRLIEYQLAGDVKLLVPCGTTGESATMTEEEDQRVIKRTIELARGRARVIAGTGSNSGRRTSDRYLQRAWSHLLQYLRGHQPATGTRLREHRGG